MFTTRRQNIPPYAWLFALLSFLCGCHNQVQEERTTQFSPYEPGDKSLPCKELSREIGKLEERISRLIEENEQKQQEDRGYSKDMIQNIGTLGGGNPVGLVAGLILIPLYHEVSNSLADNEEQVYGTETGRLILAYQERLRHLDGIAISNGC